MSDQKTVPVVLLGRFTTLAGAGRFKTTPVEVVRYSAFRLFAWRGEMADPSYQFRLSIEESNDQDEWDVISTVAIAPDNEAAVTGEITRAWLRAVVELSAPPSDFPVATCYVVGSLAKRRT